MGNPGSAGSLGIPSAAAFKADPTTNLMVFMSGSTGGGRSFTSSPCRKSDVRYSKNGCGKLGFGGVLGCAGVSIQSYSLCKSDSILILLQIFIMKLFLRKGLQ